MTLVCIHGAGCTGEVFDPVRTAFPDAVTPNLPGHDADGAAETVEAFADAIERVIEEPQLERVTVCGHSLGALIALELAARKPPWLRGCVIIGGGARLPVAPAILDGLRNDFDATVERIAGYMWAERSAERVAYVADTMRRIGAAQVLADFRACDAYDADPLLERIDVPLLALTGERDKMTPPALGAQLAGRVPRGESRRVPGAGHMLMHEAPAGTNEAVRSFVEQISI